MKGLGNGVESPVVVGGEFAGQRVDNFLLRRLKGVPRSHVYRMLRSGEVRVNSGRVDATFRLSEGDRVRIPPVRIARPGPARRVPPAARLVLPVLFEDSSMMIVDKPAGLAVHGGSGVSHGVIERLRAERPERRFLELVHRLDRDTSGVLVLAKRRSALITLHEAWRSGSVDKRYVALVKGRWRMERRRVELALRRYLTGAGERRVRVDAEGQRATTDFRRVKTVGAITWLEAGLETGRTHQIRVHLAHLGTPILGDEKYGDFALNKALAKAGLRRMFLHASQLILAHPATGERLEVNAPVPEDFERASAVLLNESMASDDETV